MEALIQVKSQLADILKNCPLTNLIQESSFGDSDYDIKKRPNCSTLQRTAQHCVCSNKTASVYLYKIVPLAENAYVAIFDSKYIINFSFKLSEKKNWAYSQAKCAQTHQFSRTCNEYFSGYGSPKIAWKYILKITQWHSILTNFKER